MGTTLYWRFLKLLRARIYLCSPLYKDKFTFWLKKSLYVKSENLFKSKSEVLCTGLLHAYQHSWAYFQLSPPGTRMSNRWESKSVNVPDLKLPSLERFARTSSHLLTTKARVSSTSWSQIVVGFIHLLVPVESIHRTHRPSQTLITDTQRHHRHKPTPTDTPLFLPLDSPLMSSKI